MSDIMQMWGMFALLTLLAVLFVVVPFLRRERVLQVDNEANAQRIDIYQQRLDELQVDLANQRVDAQMYQESVLELKRRLLNELEPEKQLNSRGNNRIFALTGLLFTLAVSGVFYYYMGSQQQIANWYDAIDKLPEYGERAVLQQGEALSPNELQAFALGLRTKLANSGDDAVAWMLLGRIAMSLNDFEMAKQAFNKALKMEPNNHNVLINYSQVLLVEGSESAMNKAARLLAKVLKSDPANVDAISLLALIAYEKQDWLEAKTAFEVLLANMQSNDPRYAMIEQRIAEIAQKISPTQSVAPVSLTANVTLDKNLLSQVPQHGTLFVFAKAASGPAMPLAVAKLTNFNLPLTVTLDDSMAMMPELKLSNYQEVVITARISVDSSVMPQAGELEGQSQVVSLVQDNNDVTVEINRIISDTGK
ncbi:c-type cytochrome biogenesis protein CcmI [Pseudoalteromonas sp. JBTF-M23]|uniref:C-type cytochrome biogenesis protein CcmI n=1 Tax=Pseudoalteromonas caenipelagi TaxID=2726988 RepID=A0A849VC26_9GAMM|nr:c-type cytochrome biogenesis protein CcmI [Pseudoalteromonas caenipelagi]NOU50836.1 c-type cytochrome biogenesis protein CcmI [Pseudoalteromonas caenipelagi]